MEFQNQGLEIANPSLSGLDNIPIEPKPLPILPRSGWNNQIRYLKVLFKSKQRLDKQEQEASLEAN